MLDKPDSIFSGEARTSFLKGSLFLVAVVSKDDEKDYNHYTHPVNYCLSVFLNHIHAPDRAVTVMRNLTIVVETLEIIFPPAKVS